MIKTTAVQKICTSAAVGALYALLTVVCAPIAFGPIQFRPAEALTLLPLLLPESIFGLFVGCLVANVMSPFGVWDIVIGSTITLLAAIITRYMRNVILGGLPPVLLNAIFLPLLWLLMGSTASYFINFISIFITQAFFVYALGIPMHITLKKHLPKIFLKGQQKIKKEE